MELVAKVKDPFELPFFRNFRKVNEGDSLVLHRPVEKPEEEPLAPVKRQKTEA